MNLTRTVSNKRAFTLVELLVVIAIIGILVALLLPAVQAARESARRAQCTNHLKQIGVALHNYHSAHGHFPTQVTGSSEASGGGCGPGFTSWIVPLLPMMEQSALYDSMNHNVGLMDQCGMSSSSEYSWLTISQDNPNAAAAATLIPTLLCPSETYQASTIVGDSTPAPNSYAGNVGWIENTTGPAGGGPITKSNGMFGLTHPSRSISWQQEEVADRHFTDGLSNTAAVAERRIASGMSLGELTSLPISAQSFCAGPASIPRTIQAWADYCTSVSFPDPIFTAPIGRSWASGWTVVGNTYMHMLPINERSCHLFGGEDNGMNMITASSPHSGGSLVLMGDGAVQFTDESIDDILWWGMGSRNGGETGEGTR